MSPEIQHASVRLLRIPVDPPALDAQNCFATLEVALVELTDGGGHSGFGFGYTIGYGGSAIVDILRDALLPALLGRDSRYLAERHRELVHSIHTIASGNLARNALAAIDVALWDLAAKRAKEPLHIRLGGAKDRVKIYNTDAGWMSHHLDELVERCEHAVRAEGFRAVKLKVGKPDPEEDAERVAKVRARVGRGIAIMADANQAWSYPQAVTALQKLAPYELTWIEEPMPTAELQAYQKLKSQTPIAIAGGESLTQAAQFYEVCRHGAFDILQPDVTRLGGITVTMEVCHLAAAAGLRVAPHVSPDLSVGVACAVPNSFFVEFIPQMNPILRSRLRIEGGDAFASLAPGHGIELDESKLKKYEVTHEEFQPGRPSPRASSAA